MEGREGGGRWRGRVEREEDGEGGGWRGRRMESEREGREGVEREEGGWKVEKMMVVRKIKHWSI